MLYSVDQNNLGIFDDLVDDAVVATSCRPETLELAYQRFAEPLRIVCYRSEDGLQGGVSHLVWESIEMT